MWKKNEPQSHTPESATKAPVRRPESDRTNNIAVIGSNIAIKGEISGKENIEIHGKFEGHISMKGHRVTVGQKGHVKADIHAKAIHIEGEVEGNLFGEDVVVLRESGRLVGNIAAARVTLEDGAKFKGSIDMEPVGGETKPSRTAFANQSRASARDPSKETTPPYNDHE